MRQPADRDGGRPGEVIGAEHLDLVEAADRHIGKCAACIAGDVDVIGDRPSVDGLQHGKGWTRAEHHRLAHVLQCELSLICVCPSEGMIFSEIMEYMQTGSSTFAIWPVSRGIHPSGNC